MRATGVSRPPTVARPGSGAHHIADDTRPMDELPYIDEHGVQVDAPVDAVWTALLDVLHAAMTGSATFARILGCDPARATPHFHGRAGETIPGFRVTAANPGRLLALRGRHRFADYALTFVIDGAHLRARTHAAFPGLGGLLYRAAVIGSGGHGIVTRHLLERVARAARRVPR